jgi:hypothetical protein
MLQDPQFDADKYLEAQLLRGYAARKIRAELRGEPDNVAPLYTEQETKEFLRRKELETYQNLTSKGFAFLAGLKTAAPMLSYHVPSLPFEVSKALHNRMDEITRDNQLRSMEAQQQKDQIMESHVAVKYARLMRAVHDYEDKLVGMKIDAPYIEDVLSTSTAGKFNKFRVLVPLDRNFTDVLESVPEDSLAHFRLQQHARAIARNSDLTMKEKKFIISRLRDEYLRIDLHKVDKTRAFNPELAIRPGRYTHMHPRRANPYDVQYEQWLANPPTLPKDKQE